MAKTICRKIKKKRDYEQLYVNKMDNLEEMDRFLEKFSLPRLNQEEIEIMNKPITITEIETVIKNLPKKQTPRTRWPHRRILSNIWRRANAWPSKTLSKYCRGRNTLPNTFYETTINLIPKTDKDNTHTKRKLQANITEEHRRKDPQHNFSKQNSATHQKAHTP